MGDKTRGPESLRSGFDGIDRVVADPLRFKLQLGIGEDAYASLRAKKQLARLWDVGGWGATGAGVAASKAVATTFFAPTGWAAMLGFGTAVTPVGWVIAAAVTTAGAYYGVTRLFSGYDNARVDTIPKFITTPIDVLGAALFDLMGGLAIRVAQMDGTIDPRETAAIKRYFTKEWGLDPAYVSAALEVVKASVDKISIKGMARQLARFQADNPDCNDVAMRDSLIDFLRQIAWADGVLDEREDLAIDAIAATMAKSEPRRARRIASSVRDIVDLAGDAVRSLANSLRRRIPR
jgi:uncharacterized tellurite resistance protein B-like protein